MNCLPLASVKILGLPAALSIAPAVVATCLEAILFFLRRNPIKYTCMSNCMKTRSRILIIEGLVTQQKTCCWAFICTLNTCIYIYRNDHIPVKLKWNEEPSSKVTIHTHDQQKQACEKWNFKFIYINCYINIGRDTTQLDIWTTLDWSCKHEEFDTCKYYNFNHDKQPKLELNLQTWIMKDGRTVQILWEGVSPNIKLSCIPTEIIATLAKRQEHSYSKQ